MKRNYRALTGLRFFAAMAVVLYHYADKVTGFHLLPDFMQRLVHCGPIALGFFFILSGFVLASSHQNRPVNNTTEIKAFWLSRFARLYPAYLLAFILFAPMALQKYVLHPVPLSPAIAHQDFIAGFILSPLMLQAWTSFSQAWNGPSWSLSVEAFFYFLFPFVALRIMRMRTSKAALILGILWILSLSLVIAKLTGAISKTFYLAYVLYNPLLWTPIFFVGIALLRFTDSWQKVSRSLADFTALAVSLSVIFICAACPISYYDLLVTTGLAPILALLILSYTHDQSRVVRMFGISPLYRLGEVSYITYILQSPLWHYFSAFIHKLSGSKLPSEEVSLGQFMLFILFLLSASFLVSEYVEKPARVWILKNFSAGKKQDMVPEVAASLP